MSLTFSNVFYVSYFFNRHCGDRAGTVYEDVDSLVSVQLTSDVTNGHQSVFAPHSQPSCRLFVEPWLSCLGASEGVLIGPSRQVISYDGMCSYCDANDRNIVVSFTHTSKDYVT